MTRRATRLRSPAESLAEKSDISGLRDLPGESGVQTYDRVHDTEAVGTHQTHSAPAQLLLDLVFERRAFRTSLSKSG